MGRSEWEDENPGARRQLLDIRVSDRKARLFVFV
jgi:hypothetical protein